jgi:hypothetical protein
MWVLGGRNVRVVTAARRPTGRTVICVSSVSIVPGLLAVTPGFDSRQGQVCFLFATAFSTALGPTQPPIQWVPGLKRPVREAPSSTEVKNVWSYIPFMVWYFAEYRDGFALVLLRREGETATGANITDGTTGPSLFKLRHRLHLSSSLSARL